MFFVRPVAKGLVFTEATAAQVNLLSFFDHVSLGVLDDYASGNLVRPIGQRRDDYLVFAHVRSMTPSSLDRLLAPLQQSVPT